MKNFHLSNIGYSIPAKETQASFEQYMKKGLSQNNQAMMPPSRKQAVPRARYHAE